MENVFDFDAYKEHIINYYYHACDSQKQQERIDFVKRFYSDDYFKMVIENTKNFLIMLLEKMKNEPNYYEDKIFINLEFDVDPDHFISYIVNGCSGGWSSDTIFMIDKTTPISKKLLEKFFGKPFRIELQFNEYEVFDELEQAGHIVCTPTFYMSAPIEDFLKLINDEHTFKLIKD